MKKILHIISSPRGSASLSIKLGNAIIEKIKLAYPGSTVTESNLVTKQFPIWKKHILPLSLLRQKTEHQKI
jgi:FMN-dependent NADH-azoreductase